MPFVAALILVASLRNLSTFFIIYTPKSMFMNSFLKCISNGDIAITSEQFSNFLYNEAEAKNPEKKFR